MFKIINEEGKYYVWKVSNEAASLLFSLDAAWMPELLKTLTGVISQPTKCKYCDNPATKHVVWLFDKEHKPARIRLPWCGCDLMTALKKIWACPYQIKEGVDYEVEQ